MTTRDAWLRATPRARQRSAPACPWRQPVRGVRAKVHARTPEDNPMRMHTLHGGLPIAPGVTLAPDGDNLMFSQPTKPLEKGMRLPGTLVFGRAGALALTFAVAAVGAKAPPGAAAATSKTAPGDMTMAGMAKSAR